MAVVQQINSEETWRIWAKCTSSKCLAGILGFMQVMYIQQTRGPAQSASAQFWRSLQLVKARLEVFCFTTGTCLDLDIAASQDLQTFLFSLAVVNKTCLRWHTHLIYRYFIDSTLLFLKCTCLNTVIPKSRFGLWGFGWILYANVPGESSIYKFLRVLQMLTYRSYQSAFAFRTFTCWGLMRIFLLFLFFSGRGLVATRTRLQKCCGMLVRTWDWEKIGKQRRHCDFTFLCNGSLQRYQHQRRISRLICFQPFSNRCRHESPVDSGFLPDKGHSPSWYFSGGAQWSWNTVNRGQVRD